MGPQLPVLTTAYKTGLHIFILDRDPELVGAFIISSNSLCRETTSHYFFQGSFISALSSKEHNMYYR
jgi:hypothetical protein